MSITSYTMMFLAAIFAPVVIFSVVALATRLRAKPQEGLDEYLISNREASAGDFVNSSTAYMLQVSTTFYFVYWGFHYGLSNLGYLLSWAAGIYLFSRFAPKLLQVRNSAETVGRFLSANSSIVRVVCSLAAISSFIGVFYVEAFFTTDFVTALLPNPIMVDDNSLWWAIFMLLCLVTILYSVLGGMRKVIATDSVQLGFAYVGLSVVFSYLLVQTSSIDGSTFIFLSALTAGLYLFLTYQDLRLKDGSAKTLLLFGSLIILAAGIITGTQNLGPFGTINVAGPFTQVAEPWGAITLLGFTILNVLWQFCDSSNYQRIASLRLTGSEDEQAATLRSLLHRLIWVSPITWGLGIVLGMLVRSAGVDSTEGISEYAALLTFLRDNALAGSLMAVAAVCGIAVAMVSVMMSTADSAVIAFVQASLRDLWPRAAWSKIAPLVIGTACLVFAVALAIYQREYSNASILVVMAGVYSALAVLSIPALLHMLGMRTPGWSVVLSVLFGLGATWWATFLPPEAWPFNVKLVLPFFAAIGGSFVFQAAGVLYVVVLRSLRS